MPSTNYIQFSATNLFRENHTILRILLATWLISSLIFTQFFNSYFFSILSVPEYAKPIDTIDDLVRISNQDFKLIFRKTFPYYKMLIDAKLEDPVFSAIGRNAQRNVDEFFDNLMEIVPKVESDKKVVVIEGREFLEIMSKTQATKRLHIGKDNIKFGFSAPVLPKRSPIWEALNFE